MQPPLGPQPSEQPQQALDVLLLGLKHRPAPLPGVDAHLLVQRVHAHLQQAQEQQQQVKEGRAGEEAGSASASAAQSRGPQHGTGEIEEEGAGAAEPSTAAAASARDGVPRGRRRMGDEGAGSVPVLPPISLRQGVVQPQGEQPGKQQQQQQQQAVQGQEQGGPRAGPDLDLEELSMLADCAHVMGTLLTCVLPHLPRRLPDTRALVRRAAAPKPGSTQVCLGKQCGWARQ